MAAEAAVDDLFGSGSESDDQEAPAQQPADQQESLEDDVEEAPGQQGAGNAGLFGSDDEDDGEAAKGAFKRASSSSGDEDDQRHKGFNRRKPPAHTGPPMDAEAPLLPLPATNSVHLVRTTNIVGIQPRAFDPATFEREDESMEDEAGRSRAKLASNAIVRWRVRRLTDGREVRESNARFVRWEDGSLQLLLGHEVLDVAEQDIRSNNQYLFVLRGLIQGQCPLGTKLALRPASLDSGLHRRLREQVDKRHVKTNKVVSAGGLQNPELEQSRREKAEDEKIRSREQLAKRQDKAARPYGGGSYRSRAPRLRDQGEEDQDGWDGGGGGDDYDDGLTADQRARLSMSRRPMLDEGQEAEAGRRLQAAKRGASRGGDNRGAAGGGGGASKKRRMASEDEDDEDEEEEEEYDDDEEEAEYESSGAEDDEGEVGGEAAEPPAKKSRPVPPPPDLKAAKPKRRGVVLSDEDD